MDGLVNEVVYHGTYIVSWIVTIYGWLWYTLSTYLLYKLFVKFISIPSISSLRYTSVTHTPLNDKTSTTIIEWGIGNAELGFVRSIMTINLLRSIFHIRLEGLSSVGSLLISFGLWFFSPVLAILFHILVDIGRLSFTIDFKDAVNDIDEYGRRYGFEFKEKIAGFLDYYHPNTTPLIS